jgi:hypothetical protein
MPTFYGAIDLIKNELRNAVVQNLGAAPGTPLKGQIYMDSATNNLYFYDGTAWVSCRSAGALTPASTVTTQAVGDAAVVGTATTYAREDHKHGRELFGPIAADLAFGSAVVQGSATTVPRSDHTHGNPTHDAAAHTAIPVSALAAATGTVNMNNNRIINLLDPPGGSTDAVTKNYVDNAIAGLSWKQPVKAMSTTNVNIASAPGSFDGVTPNPQDRILLVGQTTTSANGIYIWQGATGPMPRTTDADTGTELVNAAVYVQEGTTFADTAWVCTTNAPITIGTTPIAFAQFAGGGAVTAGAGMTQSGSTLNVIAGDTSLTVAADSIIVNTGVIATVASVNAKATKFAAALTGTASPETVTHNLNTRDILLTVYNGATPYTAVEVDWDATTVNTATIRYNPNLGAGYRCVVIG